MHVIEFIQLVVETATVRALGAAGFHPRYARRFTDRVAVIVAEVTPTGDGFDFGRIAWREPKASVWQGDVPVANPAPVLPAAAQEGRWVKRFTCEECGTRSAAANGRFCTHCVVEPSGEAACDRISAWVDKFHAAKANMTALPREFDATTLVDDEWVIADRKEWVWFGRLANGERIDGDTWRHPLGVLFAGDEAIVPVYDPAHERWTVLRCDKTTYRKGPKVGRMRFVPVAFHVLSAEGLERLDEAWALAMDYRHALQVRNAEAEPGAWGDAVTHDVVTEHSTLAMLSAIREGQVERRPSDRPVRGNAIVLDAEPTQEPMHPDWV